MPSKTISPQRRDPTRGPLKPINRTTSGSIESSTKAVINSQVLRPNVQQSNVPSYPNYITVQPGGVPPHHGAYQQPSPNILGHYSIQGSPQHLPNTGAYLNPSYQGYSRPVYRQQPGHYVNGYPVSSGYPVVTMHNAQINSPQVQLPVPQGQPHQVFVQPQGINPMGQNIGPIPPLSSAFTPPSALISRPELQSAPMVDQYHLQQHVSHYRPPQVQTQIQAPNLPGRDSRRVPDNISQPGTPKSSPSGSESTSHSPPHCSPTQVVGIHSQHQQHSSTSTSPIHPTTEIQSSNSTTSPGNVNHTSLGSSSSQVPPEVLQLLQHQDQQLRELKEQLAALLSKQNNTPDQNSNTLPPHTKDLKTTATQMSAAQSPVKSKPAPREVCTAATNTSMWYPRDTMADQTSHTHNGSAETNDSGRGSNHNDSWQTINNTADLEQHNFAGDEQNRTTQAEQQAHRWPKNNPNNQSPPRGSFEGKGSENDSPGKTISDNISLNDIHVAQIPHQTQEESIMSQMIVDMPAYTSLSPDK